MSDTPSPHNPDEPISQEPLYPGFSPVDGYVLIEQLGEGGFGAVWRARGPGGVNVAMKFIPMGRAGEAGEMRAVHLMKEIRHSNLLGMSGVWEEHGYLIVAMELADRTLLDRFKEVQKQGETGIPREELLGYMQEAAKGIDYLNSQGIQHRDIKPQNLLLVGDAVKVADFGLAKLLQRSMTGHTGTMTPHYAAPEFFRGHTHQTSDQYSLAITYTLLRGGRLPFRGSPADVMLGHLTEQPELSMLPPGEIPIVARALEKDPHDRWPSCKAFIQALLATDEYHPVTEPRSRLQSGTTTILDRTRPGSKKRTLAIGVVVAAILLVLSVPVVLLMMFGGKGDTPSPSTDGITQIDNGKLGTTTSDGKPKTDGSANGKVQPPPVTDGKKPPVTDGKNPPVTDGKKPPVTDGKRPPATDGKTSTTTDGKKPPPPQPVITFRPPGSVALTAGKSENLRVLIDRKDYRGPLALKLEDKPPSINRAEFSPVQTSADWLTSEANLTLGADPRAAAGTWRLTLTASGDGVSAKASLELTVKARPKPSLELVAVDDRVILFPTKPGALKVGLARKNYDGPVSVSFSNLPDDVERDKLTIPANAVEHTIPLKINRKDKPFYGNVTIEIAAEGATAKKDFELIVVGEFTNSIGMKFVLIPPGTYKMGSPESEDERDLVEVQREVTIPRPFFMGKYEVTQGEYRKVMGVNPSFFNEENTGHRMSNGLLPVDSVSWNDAVAFCRKLSELPGEKDKVYRLPTQAQWEYACRAGTTTPFYFGSILTYQEAHFNSELPYPDLEKYRHPRRKHTIPVGFFKPNNFGLHDMHGNISEWCSDETSDGRCIIRGGCWDDPARLCRSASRQAFAPTDNAQYNGFRVLLEYPR
jgi:formylglycine-generating enzyme required for sulfatase activity/serine/threonine protein kinase